MKEPVKMGRERRRRRKIKDPVKSILKTNDNLNKFKGKMNKKLSQILYRMELDRPILMQEKLDVLWFKNEDEVMPDNQILRHEIEKKKFIRMKHNSDLRNIYNLLLTYIRDRVTGSDGVKPSEVERKFLDILKLVVEGGWVIEEEEFYEVMNMIDAGDDVTYEHYFFFLFFIDHVKYDK